MFGRKRREEKIAKKLKVAETVAKQHEVRKNLICPCCKGTKFAVTLKSAHYRTILVSSLFKKKKHEEHLLPYICNICETCGYELSFVSFDETPLRYFSPKINKEGD